MRMNLKKICFILVMGLLGIFLYKITIVAVRNSKKFNSKIWKTAEFDDGDVRYRMLSDLTNRHNLIGMRKSDIDRLLGPSPERPPSDKLINELMVDAKESNEYTDDELVELYNEMKKEQNQDVYRYYLRRGSILYVDYEYLYIYFENDLVVKTVVDSG